MKFKLLEMSKLISEFGMRCAYITSGAIVVSNKPGSFFIGIFTMLIGGLFFEGSIEFLKKEIHKELNEGD